MRLKSLLRIRRTAVSAALALAALGPLGATRVHAADGQPQDAFTTPPPVSGDTGSLFMMMVQLIFFLIVIIGIFLLIIKFLSKKKWRWMQGRAMKSLGGLMLGPNKSLQLVDIGGSIYVLGVGDNVTLLHKIDDPDEAARIVAAFAPPDASAMPGLQSIGQWWNRWTKQKKPTVEDEDDVAASFHEMFQMKMKSVAGRRKTIEELLRESDESNRKIEP